jgi:hypothetical protein
MAKIIGLLKTRGQLTGATTVRQSYFVFEIAFNDFLNLCLGYVLMSRKNNNCGVATAATYVIVQ